MFTVNRSDIFIAVPIEDLESGIEVELGYDSGAYIAIFDGEKRIGIHLTATKISDMIDSLKEIQSRMWGENA